MTNWIEHRSDRRRIEKAASTHAKPYCRSLCEPFLVYAHMYTEDTLMATCRHIWKHRMRTKKEGGREASGEREKRNRRAHGIWDTCGIMTDSKQMRLLQQYCTCVKKEPTDAIAKTFYKFFLSSPSNFSLIKLLPHYCYWRFRLIRL